MQSSPSTTSEIAKPAVINDVDDGIDDTSISKSTRLSPFCDSTRVSSSETLPSMASGCDKGTPVPNSPISEMTLPRKDSETRATEQSKKNQKKVKKAEGRPKRPLSAYNVFFQFARTKLLKGDDLNAIKQEDVDTTWLVTELPSSVKRPHRKSHGKISFREMAKAVASKWKALDEKTRAIFEQRAQIDRDRYMIEIEIWKRGGIRPSYPHEGFPTVTPEQRRQIIDKEIAYYQATLSSQGLLPSLPYPTTSPPQQHGMSFPIVTAAPSSPPALCQPQVNYPAYQLYAVPNVNISTFHVPQVDQLGRFTASRVPLTVTRGATVPPFVQTGLQPGCYYQTAPFSIAQTALPNHCVTYRSSNDTNYQHQLETDGQLPMINMMVERPYTDVSAPNVHFALDGNICSKIDVDQDIYSDDIGAFSDDEEDFFGDTPY